MDLVRNPKTKIPTSTKSQQTKIPTGTKSQQITIPTDTESQKRYFAGLKISSQG